MVIQYTDQCNARCPQCGMRVTESFPRSKLSVAAVERIIDTAARRGVQAISLTGGEPMLYLEEVAALIEAAGRAGIPWVRTGTNGYFFRNSQKPGFSNRITAVADRLARTPLRNFWISIDSVFPEVHEAMRGFPGVIDGIRQALPIFHARGIYPSANLGINRRIGGAATRDLHPGSFPTSSEYLEAFENAYRDVFRKFYQFVINLGFTMVNTCYPMSIGEREVKRGLDPVYGATAKGDIVRYSRPERVRLFRALRRVIPEFRGRIRIFSPLTSLYALEGQSGGQPELSYPCRGGIDFFFIDAVNGHAYPCGYRGNESLGDYGDPPPHSSSGKDCRECDWECFRDPSELLGPILDLTRRPARLIGRFLKEPAYFRLWLNDMRYYLACDMFDGRRPPDRRQLNRVSPATDFCSVKVSVFPEPAGRSPVSSVFSSDGADRYRF